jgi:hypothetical protein
MIQLTYDVYLQETIHVCLLCSGENYQYDEETYKCRRCLICGTEFDPNPFGLLSSKTRRLAYHKSEQ